MMSSAAHVPGLRDLARLRAGRRPFDVAWMLLLVGALLSSAAPYYLRILDVNLFQIAASVTIYGLAHLAVSSVLDSVRDARRQRLALAALHVAGVVLLGAVWHLVGGLAAPAFLGFLLLTVPVAGFASGGLLPYVSASAATATVALVALLESPELGWYLVRLGVPLAPLVHRLPALAPAATSVLGPDTAAFSFVLLGDFVIAAFGAAAVSRRLVAWTLHRQDLAGLAEEARRDVASLSGAVLRAASLPSVLVDVQAGQIVQASETFGRRMLREREDLAGCCLTDVIEARDGAAFGELLRHGGVLPVFAYRLGPEDRVARIEVEPVTYEGTAYAYVRLRDIESLAELESSLHLLADRTLLVGEDGTVRHANRAAAATLDSETLPTVALSEDPELPDSKRTRIEISGKSFRASVLSPSVPWATEPTAIVRLGDPIAASEETEADGAPGDAPPVVTGMEGYLLSLALEVERGGADRPFLDEPPIVAHEEIVSPREPVAASVLDVEQGSTDSPSRHESTLASEEEVHLVRAVRPPPAIALDCFDYQTYWALLGRLSETNRILRFADVLEGWPSERFLLLRHDADYSTAKAMRMAEGEAERGFQATYFLLLNGSHYNLLTGEHASVPARLVDLGHEVGLHYDVEFLSAFPESRWEEWLEEQAQLLSRLSGAPVRSIAMHQPGLRGRDPFRGRTRFLNAYDPKFFTDMPYLSDSCRAWTDRAWRILTSGPVPPRFQLLVHPDVWSDHDRNRTDIFDAIHRDLASSIERAGRRLLDQISSHAAVREHEARRQAAEPPPSEDRTASALRARLGNLWDLRETDPLRALLPHDLPTLGAYYPTLRDFVDRHPRSLDGTIDSAAIVRGDIVFMGEGSVVEAGAIIHESCKLVLGPRSRVRSGAILRDEVVVGPDCTIGAHCEVTRTVILGPQTHLGHMAILLDSIVGRDVNVSGNVSAANTTLGKTNVRLTLPEGKIDSGRTHMGVLVGDGVKFGAATLMCPGCIVEPDLRLPPGIVLHGTIDISRQEALMARFFREWAQPLPNDEAACDPDAEPRRANDGVVTDTPR